MNSKYLVIGATGAIGYGFTKALLDANKPTTILVRNKFKAIKLFGNHSSLNIVEGDIHDRSVLCALAQDAEYIFQ